VNFGQAKGQTPAHPHPKHDREQTGLFCWSFFPFWNWGLSSPVLLQVIS